ncbi:SMI1/KNR4 family protein [Cellulomonas flavigena]|uniref:SMI1/KNR4 family protein n=1 Tax=Cellulomonas flavigena TaxID=1711 RepID=UPI00019E2B7D|nr:SMI1/KNR4 family protein [Cellulomonas flavigena]
MTEPPAANTPTPDDATRRLFAGVDLDDFWDDSAYALAEYVGARPSDELVASVEAELGYRLPASYVALMRWHNGGTPRLTACPTPAEACLADDEVELTGIMGIGRDRRCSVAGEAGSRFWIEEWGYPPLGVYVADCPSAGHDMIAFDYRGCGPDGEPRVVHVDQERDYRVTVLAPDFVTFVRSLRPADDFGIA